MAAAVSEFRPQVIDRVDSNKIYVGGEVVYEMGSYLGGGNASTVYECKAADRPDTVRDAFRYEIDRPRHFTLRSDAHPRLRHHLISQRLAIKQVHPINYRMSRPTMIARSMVVHRVRQKALEYRLPSISQRRQKSRC